MLALLILLPSLASAQTHRASVRGTIYDPNHSVIPDAIVTLTNQETQLSRTVTSGPEGEYTLTALAPGDYRLEVEVKSFQKQAVRFTVLVNQEQRVDVTMEL